MASLLNMLKNTFGYIRLSPPIESIENRKKFHRFVSYE
jgi:hypothetical protein